MESVKMSHYTWVPFFEEMADKLLPYANKQIELYQLLQAVFVRAGMKLPKIESDDNVTELDPFTVFAMVNRGITLANRIALCTALGQMLSISSPIPDDFPGVPVVNNQKANFMCFREDRKPNDVANLWQLLSLAIQYADHPSDTAKDQFAAIYDRVLAQRGIKWNLTMGLFWVRPQFYLNLDSRNRWFMSNPANCDTTFANRIKIMKMVPNGIEYSEICSNCRSLVGIGQRYESIADLSNTAWTVSEEVNQQQKQGQTEIVQVNNAAIGDADVRTVHYWLYAPGNNAAHWDTFYQEGILALGWGETGDAREYPSREALKEKLRQEWNSPDSPAKYPSLALWQLLHEMKNGDIVFVKQGRHKIIGRGVVTSDYEYVDDYPIEDYKHQRKVRWTHNGEWEYPKDNAPLKTLTDMTEYTGTIEAIISYFEDDVADDTPEDVIEEAEVKYPPYTADDFLSEVYMSEDEYDTLVGLLRSKKNVILQGAPGVGKTFTAKRLAYSMMGIKDQERVAMVQFHQSYSYEDFIMGFRPTATGFDLKKGAFYNFCKKAQDDPDNEYFFIIDEINRGNLSKIFGELFMLIENDKRGIGMQLLYADEIFSVPKNVMIIGMMNTADRSLAMMDYALRRRFAFFEMAPGFETDGFRLYQENLANEKFDKLITCVEGLNRVIADDESLGDGFRIGHSYFSNLDQKKLDDQALMGIVRFELIPLLKEYWFDEPQMVKEWTAKLESAVK